MNRMSWHERTCMCAFWLMFGGLAWAIPNRDDFIGLLASVADFVVRLTA